MGQYLCRCCFYCFRLSCSAAIGITFISRDVWWMYEYQDFLNILSCHVNQESTFISFQIDFYHQYNLHRDQPFQCRFQKSKCHLEWYLSYLFYISNIRTGQICTKFKDGSIKYFQILRFPIHPIPHNFYRSHCFKPLNFMACLPILPIIHQSKDVGITVNLISYYLNLSK